MGNCHPEDQLAVGGAQSAGCLKVILVHVGDAVHGSHGNGEPGTQSDDEHRAAEEGLGNDHHNRDPGGGGDGTQELDDGIHPVAAALGVAAGDAGDQTQSNARKITQEQQPQGVDGALEDHGTVQPCRIQNEVQAGHEGLGQNAGLDGQVVIESQQQEQGCKQRRAVAQLLLNALFAHGVQRSGVCTIDNVSANQNHQEPEIGVGITVHAVVGDEPVLRNGDDAAHKGQDHDHKLKKTLQRRHFLGFQLLELLPGQLAVSVNGRCFVHETNTPSIFDLNM